MPGRFWLPISALTGLDATPLAQLATPATTGLVIISIELGQETSETSQQEVLQLNRRTTASTLPTSTTPLRLGSQTTASLLTGSTTTNATGKSSVQGTTGNIIILPPFNVLNGFIWYPLPEARVHMAVSAFLTLEFKTAPAANTWSGGICFEEENL